MKKIIKKSKYLLIGGVVFFVSIIAGSKWFGSVPETAFADINTCLPPNQQFSNGCFSPAQLTTWISEGSGDGNGGGDTSGS
jgi:hypothetical protein